MHATCGPIKCISLACFSGWLEHYLRVHFPSSREEKRDRRIGIKSEAPTNLFGKQASLV